MKPVVAIIAQGAMGAGTAARLHENGVKVLTSLVGRSEGSAQRAKDAGMVAASDTEIAASDIILSIVPPREALPLARRLAPALAAVNQKPVYVDCNAISPDTVLEVERVIAQTGCSFVDAGIIGGPPRAGYEGPIFYYSGPAKDAVARLNDYSLVFRRLDAPVGAASALKMSYGGITKGLTAVGSAMMLAASKAGVADALYAELAHSQPTLLKYFTRSVPDMVPKAYRWVAEMEEIAHFSGRAETEAMYLGIAALYDALAADRQGGQSDIETLAAFFKAKAE